MAIINRLYFEAPDYSASYDYDDQALVLLAVHVDNTQDPNPLTIEIHNAADDALLQTFTIAAGAKIDRTLNKPQQASITLDDRGRVTNIYAKTV